MDAGGTVGRSGQSLDPMEMHLSDVDAIFPAQNQGFCFRIYFLSESHYPRHASQGQHRAPLKALWMQWSMSDLPVITATPANTKPLTIITIITIITRGSLWIPT